MAAISPQSNIFVVKRFEQPIILLPVLCMIIHRSLITPLPVRGDEYCMRLVGVKHILYQWSNSPESIIFFSLLGYRIIVSKFESCPNEKKKRFLDMLSETIGTLISICQHMRIRGKL